MAKYDRIRMKDNRTFIYIVFSQAEWKWKRQKLDHFSDAHRWQFGVTVNYLLPVSVSYALFYLCLQN